VTSDYFLSEVMMFCAECKYFVGYVDMDRGDCVRHAPTLLRPSIEFACYSKAEFVDALTQMTVSPVVYNIGFCGDYEAKVQSEG
jgi:hypothetical protein